MDSNDDNGKWKNKNYLNSYAASSVAFFIHSLSDSCDEWVAEEEKKYIKAVIIWKLCATEIFNKCSVPI